MNKLKSVFVIGIILFSLFILPNVVRAGADVADDAFTRNVAAGSWGSADTGGNYTLEGTGTFNVSDYSVNGSAGLIDIPSGGSYERRALLQGVVDDEVDAKVKVSIDTMPDNASSGVIGGVVARSGTGISGTSTDTYYRIEGIFLPNDQSNEIQANVVSVVDGTETTIGTATTVNDQTFAINTDFWIRTQVTGTTTVTVNVKIWEDGTAEPYDWIEFTDSAPDALLQGTGGVGMYAFRDMGVTATNVVYSFDDFDVDEYEAITPITTGTDEFTRNLSSGWGNSTSLGLYKHSGSGGSYNIADFATSGSAGTINIPTESEVAERYSFLPDINNRDIDVLVKVQMDKMPIDASDGLTVGVLGRVGDGATGTDLDTYYGVNVLFQPNGDSNAVSTQAFQNSDGTESNFGSANTVPDVTYSINTDYWIRFQLLGNLATDISVKVWEDGTAEPYDWITEQDSSTDTELQGNGGIGLMSAVTTDETGGSVGFTFDDLELADYVAPSTYTAVSDAYGRTVTKGWGESDDAGLYEVSGSGSYDIADFDTDGSVAQVAIPSGGHNSRYAFLQDVDISKLETSITFQSNKMPDNGSNGITSGLLARAGDGSTGTDVDTFYGIAVRFLPSGDSNEIRVGAFKDVDGIRNNFGTEVNATSDTYSINTDFNIKMQVYGTSKVTIKAKVWNASGAEPSTWVSFTDTSPETILQPSGDGGGVGIYSYVDSGVTGSDALFKYDDYSVNTYDELPSIPNTLDQKLDSDNSSIVLAAWVNEADIKFTAKASDESATDTLQLCIEVKDIASAFVNTEDSCGSGTAYSGTEIDVEHTITGLSSATQYHWQARILDDDSNYSSWVSYGGNLETESDFGVDTVKPDTATAEVYDGDSIGIDDEYNASGDLDKLSANWENFTDADSGISTYEYSIGTTEGGTDELTWTNAGMVTSIEATGLNLRTSQIYYFNVRAIDDAGNVSEVISSNGQFVKTSLTFSVSSSEVTFDNLNPDNDNTDKQDVILTTSTNAYGGYVIKAYKTGELTFEQSTIGDFGDGTYLSPSAWPDDQCTASDCGLGYTSSDTTIEGSNKFGGGTLYAPFSNSAPGDIVADHTTPVQGTAIENQQVTITNKVAAPIDQVAGLYTTSVIYTIIPQY